MVYKRAFLTIGEQAMGNEKSVTHATPKHWGHSRIGGKACNESRRLYYY
jgi:hypothetical protein